MKVFLRRIDLEAGMARFYAVDVMPTLFGKWAVVREWGRIGRGGTMRDSIHASEDEARHEAEALIRKKQRRGYRATAPA